jgi:hypothetical protein
MYKPFELTNEEAGQCLAIANIVAPNLAKQELAYMPALRMFHTKDFAKEIPAFEFVYEIVIHKYVTNILFNGTLKDAQAQNTAINCWVGQSCEKNLTGAHMLKNAIKQIHKELQTIK